MQKEEIIFKKAQKQDLKAIIELLFEDNLGQNRESLNGENFAIYEKAYLEIENDKNQFLLVGFLKNAIIATCQLSFIPCLSHLGKKRLQIESVRVKKEFRGQNFGKKLIEKAILIGQENNCKMAQLTTNNSRVDAQNFYQKLGFEKTHIGMKREI